MRESEARRRLPLWSGLLVVAIPIAACTGEPAAETAASPLDRGWPAHLIASPDEFAALVADPDDRAGWIALHAGDLRGAAARGGAPAARAWAEEALLQGDLTRLAAQVWPRMGDTWAQRSHIPPGSALPVVVALALPVGEAQTRWLSRPDPTYNDPDVAALAAVLRAGGRAAVSAQGPVSGCVAAHQQVRTGAAPRSVLSSACPQDGSLVTEAGGGRVLWSPLVYATLAADAARQAEAHASEAEGLAAEVFSARWLPAGEDVLAALGVERPQADEAEQGRRMVRELDGHLDAWAARVQASPDTSAEGAALLADLALVAHWRSRALLALAREELAVERPHTALAIGTMALDASAGRAVGALNPPGLFVVLAEANLRLGRSREALDMLAPLLEHWPEVAGLDETLGDLVILEGLDRIGDSKEN